MTSAAIYARVSSARQKKDETIGSQTAALRDHARQLGVELPEEWVFEDEGHSGATLVRPALERLRDVVAGVGVDVVLCYSPDRLARKFAYQALLIEEFARAGTRVEFIKGPRGDSPEDQLMVQFQGMFAEYEKAQLMERYRRGKAYRAKAGSVNVLGGAPFGYRYLSKRPGSGAGYEIAEHEAVLVAEMFRRYADLCRARHKSAYAEVRVMPRWLADDWCLMVAGTKDDAQALKEEIAGVLSTMGLRLSPEKTLITHINEGLDFLGWHIQRHRKRGSSRRYVYTYPSRKAVKAVTGKVKNICRTTDTNLPLDALLLRLNPALQGSPGAAGLLHGVARTRRLAGLFGGSPRVWCSWLVVVHAAQREIGGSGMRAFLVRLPSGARYWTVLDEDLAVVAVADSFLRQVRFGRDGAELTTRAYAGSIALFLRWCARTGREWQAGIEQLGLFMTWLAHAGPQASGADGSAAAGIVLAGPGMPPVRGARRINAVLTAVRGMVVHAVAAGQAGGHLVPLLYEVADDRDLPGAARGEEAGMSWRMRARHRLHEPERPVDRAADAGIVAVLGACRSARDRLIVLLMARAGLRRAEVLGLRRSDVHLLLDSRVLGCAVTRAHLHVVRREDNPNGAVAKSRRQRTVPLDFVTVQAFDTYEFERMRVPRAAGSDFVLVNLFREPAGAPMRLDAVNDLVTAAARRAGLQQAPTPHQMRHAFASNVLDAGGAIDEAQELLGHSSVSSTQVYTHPDPARLRAAVERGAQPS